MSDVFIPLLRVDTQVVHEDFVKNPKILLESMTHQSQKCGQSISKAERHDSFSKYAPFCSKGHLVLVIWVHGHLIVTQELVQEVVGLFLLPFPTNV